MHQNMNKKLIAALVAGGLMAGAASNTFAQANDALLNKLTGAGALYLAAVCILPTLLIAEYGIPFAFGGTSLLIVVGVSLDTVAQIEAQLLTRHYDGLQGPTAGSMKGRRQLLTGTGASTGSASAARCVWMSSAP